MRPEALWKIVTSFGKQSRLTVHLWCYEEHRGHHKQSRVDDLHLNGMVCSIDNFDECFLPILKSLLSLLRKAYQERSIVIDGRSNIYFMLSLFAVG